MIEISDGFTSITAGTDAIARHSRAPTGARVTLQFSRGAPLPPDQPVRVRYEFGDARALREGVGVAKQTHVEVRWGRPVTYHYRLSYWIAAGALMPNAAGNVWQRTEGAAAPRHDCL